MLGSSVWIRTGWPKREASRITASSPNAFETGRRSWKARRRVQGWLAIRADAPFYARKWAEILAGDAASVASFLVERTELADELRQSSPFAGALQPRERWRIWHETRDRFSPQP
jgi:hypothetical protein